MNDTISQDNQIAFFKALADATRLRLIRILYREELNVQELAQILQLAQPSVSRHLAVLRNAGLVFDRREGTKVYYTLAPLEEELASFKDYLEVLGRSQHPDLDRLEECLRMRSSRAHSFADTQAGRWDQIGRILHNSSASLLALARLAPRSTAIADLGTGTGVMLPFLTAMADHVYAIDQSARMLDQARIRCNRLELTNVTFVQSPIEDLAERVPECDALLLHFVLHQVARPHVMLHNAASLLKPGGRVVIVDRCQHEDERAKTTFGSIWLGFARAQLENWLTKAGYSSFYWHTIADAESDTEKSSNGIFIAAGSL